METQTCSMPLRGEGLGRQGQLPREIDALEEVIAQTQDVVTELENRLECVSNPEAAPDKVQADNKPDKVIASRAQDVRLQKYALERIRDRLVVILERLEV